MVVFIGGVMRVFMVGFLWRVFMGFLWGSAPNPARV